MQIFPSARLTAPPSTAISSDDSALRRAAEDIETGFLAEMLKHAGMGEMSDSFGGGIGEEQFASFLREEQARAMVAKGGIGLAEQIFQSMKRMDDHG